MYKYKSDLWNTLGVDGYPYESDQWLKPFVFPPGERLAKFETDFISTSSPQVMWAFGAISSGTNSAGTAESNHPGFTRLTSTTGANSGARWIADTASIKITGGEETVFIFKVENTANSTVRMGFHDTNSSTDATDGVYIDIQGTTLKGRTASNSGYTDTTTTYTITQGTWYRAKVVLNSNATQADFVLYAENGSVLWTDNITATIPTTAGRQVGHGVVATNSDVNAVVIVSVDYMCVQFLRTLSR